MRVLAWGSAEVVSCAFFWFMRLVLRRAWWWGVGLWLFLFEGYREVGGGGVGSPKEGGEQGPSFVLSSLSFESSVKTSLSAVAIVRRPFETGPSIQFALFLDVVLPRTHMRCVYFSSLRS